MSLRPILLDTCAAIWLLEEPSLPTHATEKLDEAAREGAGIFISPISAWEIGMLVAKGRLALSAEPEAWFRAALQAGPRLAQLTPEILLRSSFLPGALHGDPADRILASTARHLDYRLMTTDRRLLAYAEEGHMRAIAC